ncbi:MAG TPA: alkaline phosphatase PhoX, partial [Sphingorhabdus sp.]|nr:alkaline phosphatase PhoX [Sphingorhabdus sp.]
MSHLTDAARAPYRSETTEPLGADSLEAIVAANPSRRSILQNGLLGLSAIPLYSLTGCFEDGGGNPVTVTPSPPPAPVSFAASFTAVAPNQLDQVTVPSGYSTSVLLKAGDAVETGVTGYSGSFPTPAQAEKWAGGNHDGMEYFGIPGTDANSGGLLAVNFEYPDFNILQAGTPNLATLTADQRAIALSAVGVGVVEVAKGSNGQWAVKAGSPYNKRYTG